MPASTMSTAVKLAGFALGLAVLFGATFMLGSATGSPTPAGGSSGGGHQHGGGHDRGGVSSGHPVGGLAVAESGYQLRVLSADPLAGQAGELVFQVIGPGGLPVTSYVNTHDKPLHLIIARRDLSGFQHLHPVLDGAGTWRVPLTLPAAGDYRAFADFVPDGRTDTLVLGTDLAVAGDYRPVALPAPATETTVDGYAVRMLDRPAAGGSSPVRFTISRDGQPVTDLEPYLGAYGHLVALRQGDLGYLHVHPDGQPGQSPPGPEIGFTAELPSAGGYRLYLDFSHRGTVRTAEFTIDAPTNQ